MYLGMGGGGACSRLFPSRLHPNDGPANINLENFLRTLSVKKNMFPDKC